MTTSLRFSSILLALLLPLCAKAQHAQMPVDAQVHLVPPYSVKLDDYVSSMKEKISLVLINRDNEYPDMQVKLDLTIKAHNFTLKTKPYNYFPPLRIDPGIPFKLSNEDLEPYFNPKNYTVTAVGNFANTRTLPSGMVEFVFQVLDYRNGNKLSNSSSAMAFMATQKAAQLQLPLNGKTILFQEPLNELFQWTITPSGANNIEYELIIKQIFDPNANPQQQWPYSPTIFQQLISPQNSFLYDAFAPTLSPGYRYAWAVQAKIQDGTEQLNVLQNNGLSEIRWFRIEEQCRTPLNSNVSFPYNSLQIDWTPFPENTSFTIQYRRKKEKNEPFYPWISQDSDASSALINFDFAEGVCYQYRIGAQCFSGKTFFPDSFDSIVIPRFDTITKPNCGKPPLIDLSNREPLPVLKIGDVFMASDVPVTVQAVSGENGIFSGEGYMILPNIFRNAKLKVRWSEILVNNEYRMIEGSVKGVSKLESAISGDLDQIFEGGGTVGEIKMGVIFAQHLLDFEIPSDAEFYFNPNNQHIQILQGENNIGYIELANTKKTDGLQQNTAQSIFPLIIQDNQGNVYRVEKPISEKDSLGEKNSTSNQTPLVVTHIAKKDPDIAKIDFSKKATEATVRFDKGDGFYAFDTFDIAYNNGLLIRDKYLQFGNQYVPFKLIPPAKSDRVGAHIVIHNPSIDPEKVFFASSSGTLYQSNYIPDQKRYSILLAGAKPGDGQEIYALYKEKRKTLVLGKLLLMSYLEHRNHLVLVPVNGAKIPLQEIENVLQEIYAPLGESWQVDLDTELAYEGSTDFFLQSSALLQAYTPSMKDFNAFYASQRPTDPRTTYLFFFPGKPGDRNVNGFMPRNKPFGYLFTDAFEQPRKLAITVAHEIAHGCFLLKHPFDNAYKIPQNGLPKNLMDYSFGTLLAKWQWDLIKDPGVVNRVFETEEDAFLTEKMMEENFEEGFISIEDESPQEKKYCIYVTPGGCYYALPLEAKPRFFTTTNLPIPETALVGFEYQNKIYLANYTQRNGKIYFSGYSSPNDKKKTFRPSEISQKNIENLLLNRSKSTRIANVVAISATLPTNYIHPALTIVGGAVVLGVTAYILLENVIPNKSYLGANYLITSAESLILYDRLAEANALVYNPPKEIVVSIPFRVPIQKGDCRVYVIYRQNNDSCQIGKYGMTCKPILREKKNATQGLNTNAENWIENYLIINTITFGSHPEYPKRWHLLLKEL